MKRWRLVLWLLLSFTFAYGQNTSNKGTEFWVAYPAHVDGDNSRLYLYITSDVNTKVEVSIGGTKISGSPFTISANAIKAILIDPKLLNVYVGTSDEIEQDKAILITAEKPVVVYSHIFHAARSGATLVLPTKVLGREYYVSAYVQNSYIESPDRNPRLVQGYSEFTIIGVADHTQVEITPKARERNGRHQAGLTFTKELMKGEIYQYQSTEDLSGTHIVSVAGAAGGCQPIAVFSGSSWVGFCSSEVSSTQGGDNLYQQLYPTSAWGKEFMTAPMINKPHDIFRVYFSKDNTSLTINGTLINAGSSGFSPGPLKNSYNKGEFFEFSSSQPNHIVASEPISLVQYQISQGCDPLNVNSNNPVHPGDPEMTILNPLEQTLSRITVYSALRDQVSPRTQITQHFINVIIKNDYISSFRINGAVPVAAFVPIAGSVYSYLQENVTQVSLLKPTHTLIANGGFSAIAYGYGSVESYGYLAGADVRNLFQNIEIINTTTGLKTPDVCTNASSEFVLTLPYPTSSLTWVIDGVPQPALTTPVATPVVIDGVTVYTYHYHQPLVFNAPGKHKMKVEAINPNPSGCEPKEEVSLDFEVFAPAVADFRMSSTNSCTGTAVTFTDKSDPKGKAILKWTWNFGDGTGDLVRDNGAPFEHIYVRDGEFTVRLKVDNENGCGPSSSLPKQIHVKKVPEANFDHTDACVRKPVKFRDLSVPKEGVINKWYWDFGDPGSAGNIFEIADPAEIPEHTYAESGTYTVTLKVERSDGCTDDFTVQLRVNKLPEVDFESPEACVSDVIVFENLSEDHDGSTLNLRYLWDFGDPGSGALNTSTDREGRHQYRIARKYKVTLTVTNAAGCSVTKENDSFELSSSDPVASFELVEPGVLCSGQSFKVKNTSTLSSGKIRSLEWFLDGVSQLIDNAPVLNKVYTLNYGAFVSPESQPVILKLVVNSGLITRGCTDTKIQQLTFHAIPVAHFNILQEVCLNQDGFQVNADALKTGESSIFSGTGISSDGFFNPILAGAGTHTIKYKLKSASGCTDEQLQDIKVLPLPEIDAGSDLVVLVAGKEKPMNASASGAGLEYKWTPSAGLSRDDVLNPMVKPDQDTEYTLTVRSANGCSVSDLVKVKVLDDIRVPNAFSPNGDGLNEVWNIENIDSYPAATVEIYNRYGQRVFSSHGYARPFDGTFEGQVLPVGTYYYLIRPHNGRKDKSGALTLIR
ncbi:PKD domain-containing protein [Pedobacter caeni]|uniref:Gliding motility-associated C-terminal domain-containing protein n=1 Tax=Pedobacter caeni TaxID=288992 RepID=A0A1M5GBA8_9SPHI|nr:PKD domain-containing protein [Pedobacter caeni]SHG00979.1 gliding motility-associated C-terminal domain-containing protein [Pedobacter caeni]